MHHPVGAELEAPSRLRKRTVVLPVLGALVVGGYPGWAALFGVWQTGDLTDFGEVVMIANLWLAVFDLPLGVWIGGLMAGFWIGVWQVMRRRRRAGPKAIPGWVWGLLYLPWVGFVLIPFIEYVGP